MFLCVLCVCVGMYVCIKYGPSVRFRTSSFTSLFQFHCPFPWNNIGIAEWFCLRNICLCKLVCPKFLVVTLQEKRVNEVSLYHWDVCCQIHVRPISCRCSLALGIPQVGSLSESNSEKPPSPKKHWNCPVSRETRDKLSDFPLSSLELLNMRREWKGIFWEEKGRQIACAFFFCSKAFRWLVNPPPCL